MNALQYIAATVEPGHQVPAEFKSGMACDTLMALVVREARRAGIQPDPNDRVIRPAGPFYVDRANGAQGLQTRLDFKNDTGDTLATLVLVSDRSEAPKSCTMKLLGGHQKYDWNAAKNRFLHAETHELGPDRRSWALLMSGLRRCAAMQSRIGISSMVPP